MCIIIELAYLHHFDVLHLSSIDYPRAVLALGIATCREFRTLIHSLLSTEWVDCGGAHEISGIPAPLCLCGWVVGGLMGWVGVVWVGVGVGGGGVGVGGCMGWGWVGDVVGGRLGVGVLGWLVGVEWWCGRVISLKKLRKSSGLQGFEGGWSMVGSGVGSAWSRSKKNNTYLLTVNV